MRAALVVALISSTALAEPRPPTFDTRRDKAFGDARGPIREFLRASTHVPAGTHHFCVIGYRHETGNYVEVYWKEGRRIIRWEASYPEYRNEALVRARHMLDLDTDVVETLDDIGGSTYLVTREWVNDLIADCHKRGTDYAVARPAVTRSGRSARQPLTK